MAVGKSRDDKIFDIINMTMLIVVTTLIMYPLLFVVIASMSDPDMLNSGKVFLWPRGITFESYMMVLQESQVWTGYKNTIFYVVVDVVLSLTVILPVSYALSRPDRLKGAGIITFVITFTMLFSGGIIPLYLVMKQRKMINTVWAITVPNTVAAYLIIITRTFFKTSLPNDLYDAAEIDGASFAHTYFRLVLPLSTAIIAVLALFRGVGQWNSFFQPLIFLTDREKYPLQLVLRNILLVNESLSNAAEQAQVLDPEAMLEIARRGKLVETMKYSLIIIASAPVLMIYPFLQKYMLKGVMLGAIKG